MELSQIKGLKLTPAQKGFLESRKISTLEELMAAYPRRYVPIVPCDAWQLGDEVLFCGVVVGSRAGQRIGGGRILTRFEVMTWNVTVEVSVFSYGHFPRFETGKTVTVCGVLQSAGRVTASWTSFQPLPSNLEVYPLYSLPAGTRRDMMLRIMDKALPFVHLLPERTPQALRDKYRLLPLGEALEDAHRPPNEARLAAAIRTLKYEEFLSFHCARLALSSKSPKTPRQFDRRLIEKKIADLPFALSQDQRQAVDDILEDLGGDFAMYRLLQGDVGCGKTIVGAMALYAVSLAGLQSALLAPTEILARQHVESLRRLGLDAVLYCASLKAKEKKQVLEGLQDGSIDIVVGTHSLFSDPVVFDRLGLVIADEQQRFGVLQRRALVEKGHQPDVLLMSATPIPRTAAHFLYGDIDLSAIHTMPPGRRPVKTRVYHSSSMKPVLSRILEGIEQEGRQVYVVTPAVEENEETGLHSAQGIYEGLCSVLGTRFSIGLLHGKMKTEEKQAIMDRFASGEVQILVSTTVIEVGIDVPKATLMVIYDAHRFGLATLHQLRGRCARGPVQGECYLLSSSRDVQARSRLAQMETITNGFDLAQYDLELRGPGDLLGTRQSGLPAFILGDAQKDLGMMECCAQDAREILDHPEDPDNREMIRFVRQALESGRFVD